MSRGIKVEKKLAEYEHALENRGISSATWQVNLQEQYPDARVKMACITLRQCPTLPLGKSFPTGMISQIVGQKYKRG
jgi:hypothetical protein